MSEWKSYLDNRLIKQCNGFYVIKPAGERNVIPLSCPVCDHMLRTYDDEKSYRNFECCESCETFWARPNMTAWRQGWRPDKKDVALKFQNRKKMTVNMSF